MRLSASAKAAAASTSAATAASAAGARVEVVALTGVCAVCAVVRHRLVGVVGVLAQLRVFGIGYDPVVMPHGDLELVGVLVTLRDVIVDEIAAEAVCVEEFEGLEGFGVVFLVEIADGFLIYGASLEAGARRQAQLVLLRLGEGYEAF